MNITSRFGTLLTGLVFSLCLAFAGENVLADGAKPADPQPEERALKPGLAVDYYYVKLDKLDELYGWLGNKSPIRASRSR